MNYQNNISVNNVMNLDEYMNMIDLKIDQELNSLINSLGYKVHESMSFEEIQELNSKMVQGGCFPTIDTYQEGMNYIVNLSVGNLQRNLVFDLEETTK
ncbi:hypothetical protein BACCIP111899_04153 [Bacillus rhizoplanae]|uniref:Uncharacterized protein n=1 Tax=Bacillus rhizoplanae TaxID=2880966 RepID=A0ABN8A5R3_9BACI|nr:hypothetical protein [Bacillus rhizoplanae]CAG9614920.1 hypothetical protein BACCIP111899_04153 [Bacillus rhizoplanae]